MLTEAELKKARIEFEDGNIHQDYTQDEFGMYINGFVRSKWVDFRRGYQAALSSCIADIRVAIEKFEEIAYGNHTITESDCAAVAKEALSLLSKYTTGGEDENNR